MRIIPTKRRGCCAVPRTPASPTMPMAKPAARPEKPTERPAPRWIKPLQTKQLPTIKSDDYHNPPKATKPTCRKETGSSCSVFEDHDFLVSLHRHVPIFIQ